LEDLWCHKCSIVSHCVKKKKKVGKKLAEKKKKLSKNCQKFVKKVVKKVVKKLKKLTKGSARYHWSFYVSREAMLKEKKKDFWCVCVNVYSGEDGAIQKFLSGHLWLFRSN
jgi:hypothetical protein